MRGSDRSSSKLGLRPRTAGIRIQISWLPLGAEDGQARYQSRRYQVPEVVKQHPDWLLPDKNAKHTRMVRNLAALCPALPEVQEYYEKATERFIVDWGFDGHKLENGEVLSHGLRERQRAGRGR